LWKNSANIKFSKICGHSAPIRSLCFSKNDQLILTASNDKSVRIYQTTNKLKFFKSYIGHTNWVTSSDFSPDNTSIASGSDDMNIRIWDTETT
jgi:WD40 repeat protein